MEDKLSVDEGRISWVFIVCVKGIRTTLLIRNILAR